VEVNSITIGLPDFNQHIANWVPASIQNAPGKVRDLADGGIDRIIDNDEVIVRIQRKVVRIKRARSEEHTSELQSLTNLACLLLLLRPPRATLFPYTTLFRSVEVNSITIGLPDFNQHIANWVPASIQNAPGKVRDLADGGIDRIIDNDEVIVRIQRKVVRIKRA